jgi:signal transduction histidine kinase
MAQDLHDGLGQYLSALAFHARILSDDLREHHSSHAAQAERIVEIIRTTNQTIRRLDRALRVPDTTETGLSDALRALVDEFRKLTGLRCQLELGPIEDVLDPYRVLNLLRIVQEAMSNAVKHGKPQSIEVSTELLNGMLHTRIADDGIGFSGGPETETGSGRRIMKMRAEMIGAQLRFGPNGTSGCLVECILPLSVARDTALRS